MALRIGVRQYEDSAAARFLTVLIAGFALLIFLLGASVWVGIDAIRSTEATASQLVEEQRAMLRLIEDIQQEQDNLSAIFYSLAADQSAANRAAALRKLDSMEITIRDTLAAGLSSRRPEYWNEVRGAVDGFVTEGRSVIHSGGPTTVAFFRSHEALISALGTLVSVNFDAAAAAEKQQAMVAGQRVRSSLVLLGAALLTALTGAVLTVRIVSRMYRQLQWQRSELAHLSSRTMADQEETARRFSRELHDEFGQTLSAIEASLVSMHNARHYDHSRMEDALVTIKAAIGNARELSQLLRPSILDDFGLDTSLGWLADSFSQRTGIRVDYVSHGVRRTDGETETQLFRIAQEALTNVARHANATLVRMELQRSGNALVLTVSDDGKGLPDTKSGTGLGLVGMRARSRAADGTLTVSSSPGKGVTIRAEIQVKGGADVTQNSHHTGG
jgi:signal transduction histidine kinase